MNLPANDRLESWQQRRSALVNNSALTLKPLFIHKTTVLVDVTFNFKKKKNTKP